MGESLESRIQQIINVINEAKERMGKSKKSRLLAIAVTHLEAGKLFIQEAVRKENEAQGQERK